MGVKQDITKSLKREYELGKEYENRLKELGFFFASPIRRMIITALFLKGELTKTEIYDLIKKAGLEIAYKNVSVNLDQLEKLGLVNYKKGDRYNATLVSVNTKNLFEYQDKLISKEIESRDKTKELMNKRIEDITTNMLQKQDKLTPKEKEEATKLLEKIKKSFKN